MYKVIKFFTDLQDNGHAYNVGDTFPRDGITVSEKRINELASTKNRQHKALIKKIVDNAGDVATKAPVEPAKPAEPVEARSDKQTAPKPKKTAPKSRKRNKDDK